MPPKKTLVIVGGHAVTREFTPWDKEYKDFWVFNEAAPQEWVKRVDAVIQIHKPYVFKSKRNLNDPKHYEWLQQQHDFPIYMQEEYPEIPSSVKYPLEEIVAEYLPGLYRMGKKRKKEQIEYFTSSVSYALALGLYLGYEKIELYGVEMATDTEYGDQRAGVYFWQGIALGRGVEIQIHEKSISYKALKYGYEGDIVIHRQAFENQSIALSRVLQNAEAQVQSLQGQLQLTMNTLADPNLDAETQEKFAKQFNDLNSAHKSAILELGRIQGALSENQRYMVIVDEQIKSIGGEKAFKAITGDNISAILEIAEEAVVDPEHQPKDPEPVTAGEEEKPQE